MGKSLSKVFHVGMYYNNNHLYSRMQNVHNGLGPQNKRGANKEREQMETHANHTDVFHHLPINLPIYIAYESNRKSWPAGLHPGRARTDTRTAVLSWWICCNNDESNSTQKTKRWELTAIIEKGRHDCTKNNNFPPQTAGRMAVSKNGIRKQKMGNSWESGQHECIYRASGKKGSCKVRERKVWVSGSVLWVCRCRSKDELYNVGLSRSRARGWRGGEHTTEKKRRAEASKSHRGERNGSLSRVHWIFPENLSLIILLELYLSFSNFLSLKRKEGKD